MIRRLIDADVFLDQMADLYQTAGWGDKEVHFSLRDLEQNIDAQEEIELSEVVRETVKELRKNGLLKRSDDVAYSEVSSRLYEYYRNPERDPEVGAALEMIKGDYYAKIIPDYYKEKMSFDWLAEEFDCELSTITRNKKRLCLKIFQLLQ